MKDKSETYTIKLNPIKEDISKQRKDKENKVLQKKKTEHKLIKDSLSMFPFKGFNFIRSEIRNTTAPNKNADVNKQNNDGDTALHLALKNRNFEIIKLIMSKKPALDIKNKEGIIPLDLFTPQMKVYFNIERLSFEDKKK